MAVTGGPLRVRRGSAPDLSPPLPSGGCCDTGATPRILLHRTAILTPQRRECASRSSTVWGLLTVRIARPGLLGTPGLAFLSTASAVWREPLAVALPVGSTAALHLAPPSASMPSSSAQHLCVLLNGKGGKLDPAIVLRVGRGFHDQRGRRSFVRQLPPLGASAHSLVAPKCLHAFCSVANRKAKTTRAS